MQVDHAVDAGLVGLARLLASPIPFDGLVVGGEIWTAAIVLRMLKVGRTIPDDVAIVGIGEIELGQYLPVPLTYVALPRRETGTQSAKLAMSLSRGDPPEEKCIKLPVKLIIHETA